MLPLSILADCLRAATHWPETHRLAVLHAYGQADEDELSDAESAISGAAIWALARAEGTADDLADSPDDAVMLDAGLAALSRVMEPIYHVGGRDGMWCLYAPESDIAARAEAHAQRGREGAAAALEMRSVAAEYGEAAWAASLGVPTQGTGPAVSVPGGCKNHVLNPALHRRRIRRAAGLARVQAAATLGLIGGQTGVNYASAAQVAHRAERDEAVAKWAAGHQIVAADGNRVALVRVEESSREAKLARTYAVCLGIQQWAVARGMVPLMLSLSLDSPWHANPTKGKRHEAAGTTKFNVKAMKSEMSSLLTQLRHGARNRDIPVYGIRVFEPNKDGTIHVHLPMFVANEADAERLHDLANDVFGSRPGAVDLKYLDRDTREACSAAWATYALAYVLAPSNNDEAAATRAWASDLGVRRWAVWGCGNRLGLWDRAYKAKSTRAAALERGDEPTPLPESVAAVVLAMCERRWGDVLVGLGILPPQIGCPRESVLLIEREPHPLSGVSMPSAVVDSETGECLPWRPVTWRIEAVEPVVSDDDLPLPTDEDDSEKVEEVDWAARRWAEVEAEVRQRAEEAAVRAAAVEERRRLWARPYHKPVPEWRR